MKKISFILLMQFFASISVFAQFSISGVTKREDQVPIFKSKVFISNADDVVLDSVLTNEQGAFVFDDLAPGEYHLSATRSGNPLNGITAFDIQLATLHIQGLSPLNSVYKLIASDINHSGGLTASDLVEYNNLLMGLPPTLPGAFLGWYFFDENYLFNNPVDPWIIDFWATDTNPSIITIQVIDSNIENINFTGFKIGDLDLDNDPTN